ncbi:MAG: hypothetical protein JW932_13935 [Deltaproteobacteria bacterium]|nr:hypothetical protein [Deltaproteobacteria bacterium]
MASNFRILTHRDGNSLHLKLLGDFDGASAHELLNMLKVNGQGVTRIFIHTNTLKKLYPFGEQQFQSRVKKHYDQNTQIFFTGDKAAHLAPTGSIFR